jgi:hypothetical protein
MEDKQVTIDERQNELNAGWDEVNALHTERNTLAQEGHLSDLQSEMEFRQTYWMGIGQEVTSQQRNLTRISDQQSVDYAVQEAVIAWLQARQNEQQEFFTEAQGRYQEEFQARQKQIEEEKWYQSMDTQQKAIDQ